MLSCEVEHRSPVPERAPREERVISDRRVGVLHDRLRYVPALPAGLRHPVTQLDVLAVQPEAFVEAAELVERGPPKEEESAEHPVGLDRLGRALVEEIVPTLPALRAKEPPQRGPAHQRPGYRREAAARRLPRSIGVAKLRTRDAAAGCSRLERRKQRDRIARRNG